MELLSVPIQTIYLYTLIGFGTLTFLYILFGDVLDALFEGIPGLNPTLIFSFFTIFSASGYILEQLQLFSSILNLIVSAIIALLLVTLLNIFVLIPLSSAEESIAFTESSLQGRIGELIIPIPIDGYGEVVVKDVSGTISKPAISLKNQEILSGTKVLIVEIKNGNAVVVTYEPTNYTLPNS
ncbi:hypothetical protein ABEP17_18680 [Priestia flexa]|uniref:Membrane protein NfeD2 N-terminal transmembrane domain-containing protein n=2 Tax=Priestia TaxID=2800373 RepID=A0A0V8JPA1_9BACI|nr:MULTISPECIES: hypothetical protein [Bacillaceae]AQX53204.1 hypothetical protein BC359_02100 [Priestia flexa]KSU88776.1 hypothetical protein AS180_05535 [Priestia veravalensis]KZB92333.1 hypothetical protein A2U94_05690 [Bacillus sp. VT 712]MBY6086693.1 YqiJ family protein [Priestia flexa]MCA1202365.1 YqiJ family protein [Priestia flexa]